MNKLNILFFMFLFLMSCSSMNFEDSSRGLASVQTIKDDILFRYVRMPGMVPDSERKVYEILFGKSGRVYKRETPLKSYNENKRAQRILVMTLDKKIIKGINSKISELNSEKLLKVKPEKIEPYPCDAGNRSLRLIYLNKEITVRDYIDCKGVYKIKKDDKLFTETLNLNELATFLISLIELTNLN